MLKFYHVGSRDGAQLVSLAHLPSHLVIKESAQLERIFVSCYVLLIIFQKNLINLSHEIKMFLSYKTSPY